MALALPLGANEVRFILNTGISKVIWDIYEKII